MRAARTIRSIFSLVLAVLVATAVAPTTAWASSDDEVVSETPAIGEAASLALEDGDETSSDDGAESAIELLSVGGTSDSSSTLASAANLQSSSLITLRVTGTEMYDYAYQVLDLVNQERAAAGLSPLTMDATLLEVAMQRAAETTVYWDHTRPNGKSCFTITSIRGSAGENIAAGQATPATVMDGWMNSSGHRANILSSSYKSVGIGCFRGSDGILRWVQFFSSASPNATSRSGNVTATHEVEVDLSFFEPSLTVSVGTTSQGGWYDLGLGQSATPTFYLTNSGVGRPAIEGSSFTWESSNPAHVSVAKAGTITAVGQGTATVTVSLGSSDDTFEIRVMSGLTPNGVYSDVDGSWAEGWIMAATEAGLLTGYTSAGSTTVRFGADDTVTRGQLATILYRHANPDSDATTSSSSFEANQTGMSDVKDYAYYTAALNWAYREGIMTGDVDAETGEPVAMRPDDPVNRQEAATMLARYAAYCGVDTTADPSVYASAPDASKVMSFAREAVAWCYEMGIMTGYGTTGELGPRDSTTRGAIAKMAVVTMEVIG